MYYKAYMMTVEKICDQIGRKPLAEALHVSKAAITNAISEGKFPPRWYRVVSAICRDHGIGCRDDLFAFIEPPEDAA